MPSPAARVAIVISAVVLLLAAAVGAALFVLVSDSGGGPDVASAALRLGGAEPETLDPALAHDSTSTAYLSHIHAGLVRLDEQLRVVPDLAAGWQTSPDGRTFTFTLRDDARFHDGKLVTAADVKYSLERAADPATKSPVAATYLGDIAGLKERLAGRASEVVGVKVLDERTVSITIDAPKAYFLAKLTYPVAAVLDRANVEIGAEWFKRPNGAGLYRLASLDKEWLVLQRSGRNPYQGAAPYEVRFYLGNRSHMAMYETGELDVIALGLGDRERALDPRSSLNRDLRVSPSFGVYYLGLNVNLEPFDDRAVRRAFAQAIDKDRIVAVTLKDSVRRAEGILPPGLAGYDPAFKGLPFDLDAARRSLAASSYGDASRLPPVTITGGLGPTLAQVFYRSLGVEVEVEMVREGYFEALASGSYQMFFAGWMADYPDPENFLDVLLHSQSRVNYGRYSNPAVDRLLEAARVEQDQTKRVALYREVERIAVDDAAIVPLYHDASYTLVKPRVKGLTITPMGILSFRGVALE